MINEDVKKEREMAFNRMTAYCYCYYNSSVPTLAMENEKETRPSELTQQERGLAIQAW